MSTMTMISEADETRNGYPALLVVSAWFGALFIGVTAVHHAKMPAWSEPLLAGLTLLWLALLLTSLLFLAWRAGDGLWLAALPLLINLGTLLIVRGVPFAQLWQEARFAADAAQYEAAAALVAQGALLPDVSGTAVLPPPYHDLSADGRVWFADGSLIFIAERSGAGQTAYYIYRADDTPPPPPQNGRWRLIHRQRPHWYFCQSD